MQRAMIIVLMSLWLAACGNADKLIGMVMPSPTAIPVPTPTKVPCDNEVRAWSHDIQPILSDIVYATAQIKEADAAAYAKTVESSIRRYLAIENPTCDPDVMAIHQQLGSVLTHLAQYYIRLVDQQFELANEELAQANTTMENIIPQMKIVLQRYPKVTGD